MARKVDEKGTQQRREQILQAALFCFNKNGIHKSSMKEICAEAQLSPGTVYHYFPSKDAIILHIVKEEMEKAKERASLIAATTTVDELLQVIVDDVVHEPVEESYQLYLEFLSEVARNKTTEKYIAKIDTIMLKALKKRLKALRNSKTVSLDSLTVFISAQINHLEFFKLFKPSAKEKRETIQLMRASMRHLIDTM